MESCKECGKDTSMPYECRRCKNKFCSEHRLPENHNCPGLNRGGKTAYEIQQNSNKSSSNKIINSTQNSFLKNTDGWKIILGLIGITYILQLITFHFISENLHDSLFVLTSDNISYVWTYFTSIFAHSMGSPMHIIGNAIILLFFGRLLEKIIGKKKFIYLFSISGILAGLAQVGTSILIENTVGVLGASGGLLAIMGALTVYNPKMKVYLYFLLPIPLWAITIGYSVLSVVGILSTGLVLGNVAHTAHLVGLLIGIIYGVKTKDEHHRIPNRIST